MFVVCLPGKISRLSCRTLKRIQICAPKYVFTRVWHDTPSVQCISVQVLTSATADEKKRTAEQLPVTQDASAMAESAPLADEEPDRPEDLAEITVLSRYPHVTIYCGHNAAFVHGRFRSKKCSTISISPRRIQKEMAMQVWKKTIWTSRNHG